MDKKQFLVLVIVMALVAGAIIWYAERTKKQIKNSAGAIGGDLQGLQKTLTDPNASASIANIRGIADDATSLAGTIKGMFGNGGGNTTNYTGHMISDSDTVNPGI
jgi:hypothetical protein